MQSLSLKVELHVCGHYGCGGIEAALGNKSYGIIKQMAKRKYQGSIIKFTQKEIDANRKSMKVDKRLGRI